MQLASRETRMRIADHESRWVVETVISMADLELADKIPRDLLS